MKSIQINPTTILQFKDDLSNEEVLRSVEKFREKMANKEKRFWNRLVTKYRMNDRPA